MSESKPKCVLAYSGGLDTSVILTWLCEKGFDVIAFCADVGQHHEDFEAVKAKAVACGALKCVVTDLRHGASFVPRTVIFVYVWDCARKRTYYLRLRQLAEIFLCRSGTIAIAICNCTTPTC